MQYKTATWNDVQYAWFGKTAVQYTKTGIDFIDNESYFNVKYE